VTERIKFTVFRNTWLRGGGDGNLLDAAGCRCCLGFLGRQLGCSDDDQRDVGLPQELDSASKWPTNLVALVDDEDGSSFMGTCALDEIIGVNDSMTTSDDAREQQLTELFAALSIDVDFKDSEGA
jgi:hypothetical protein